MTQFPDQRDAYSRIDETFEAPARTSSNGLGIAGFILSLGGLLTGGLLSPIGLILSFVAVFRAPRGFAIAGLIISGVGSCCGLFLWVFIGGFLAMAGVDGFRHFEDASRTIQIAVAAEQHRQAHAGALPTSLSELKTLPPEALRDSYGRAYRYVPSADGRSFEVVSDGADAVADNADDLRIAVTGLQLKFRQGAPQP